jgi:transcriptional regulator with XRE-family HTH domain
MYVRTLFKIARLLGVSQKEIGTRLRVSKTVVSLWAKGHRPVSEAYREPLVQLFATAIAAAERRHDAAGEMLLSE